MSLAIIERPISDANEQLALVGTISMVSSLSRLLISGQFTPDGDAVLAHHFKVPEGLVELWVFDRRDDCEGIVNEGCVVHEKWEGAH